MTNKQVALRNLHIAIFLFGFTAILGDLIQLSALMIVWWRVLITAMSLLFLVNIHDILRKLNKKQIIYFMSVGIIVGLHWVTFYGAVKLANASIALICLATSSFFTSIFEPLILGRRFRLFELLLGLAMVPGMWLILNGAQFDIGMGMVVGLMSALFASLFSIFNKRAIDDADPLDITFIELSSAWVFLSLILPFVKISGGQLGAFWPSWLDFGYLLVLALLCTTLAYVLALKSLKYISAFLANLSINLEPVYGIILAWWLLGDGKDFNINFIYGCLIILAAIGTYPLLNKYVSNQG